MMDDAVLETLAVLADESEAAELAAEARALAARVAEGRFYVACVGQFKRGKSTLINALVGAGVLPTGVVPVTSIPTVVRFGRPAARVRLARGGGWVGVDRSALGAWVTEEGNPANRKQVVGVEVFEPSPLLATGMCLVDTPGLGSIFDASTRATREFVPQIDAAVVVLGVDPPISAAEIELITSVAAHVAQLVFVLNKADRFRADERNEARAFTERTLSERLVRPVGPLFEVSALAASRSEPDGGEWSRLVQALERMAAASGESLIAGAMDRGGERLARRLERLLAEQHGALLRPIDESERRMRELNELTGEADRALAELAPLLGLDQQRVSRSFGTREEAFLARAVPTALKELREQIIAKTASGSRLRRRPALELANAVARRLLDPWLLESERSADAAYQEAVAGFAARARALLARLASAGAVQVAEPGLGVDDSAGFSAARGFYFTDLLHRHLPATPWVWLVDALAPRTTERRRAVAAAEAYVVDLLRVNAARVRGDLDDRLGRSRQRLEVQLRIVLHEAREGAARALDRARAARAAGQPAVARELAGIEARLARLSTGYPARPVAAPTLA
jgi:GTP-binding protein EngB required for normal cell division